MRKGDSSSNIVLFLTVLVAGIILSTWYIQAVRPVRYATGTVQEDVREINQHLLNACGVSIYRANFTPVTKGFLEINATHLCIYNPSYGECHLLPCAVESGRMLLDQASLDIEKENGKITINLSK